jgi:hypothetical protein
MKKIKQAAALVLLAASVSSCATVFGGPVTAYQKTPPAPGQPSRDIRVAALVADVIFFWPGAVIDFATGAIYKPQSTAAPVAVPNAAPTVQPASQGGSGN